MKCGDPIPTDFQIPPEFITQVYTAMVARGANPSDITAAILNDFWHMYWNDFSCGRTPNASLYATWIITQMQHGGGPKPSEFNWVPLLALGGIGALVIIIGTLSGEAGAKAEERLVRARR